MQSTQNTRFAPEPTTNSERERAFRPIAPDNFSVLSRFLNLIFVANATLFIGSRLVITHGYWFCLVAIGCDWRHEQLVCAADVSDVSKCDGCGCGWQ